MNIKIITNIDKRIFNNLLRRKCEIPIKLSNSVEFSKNNFKYYSIELDPLVIGKVDLIFLTNSKRSNPISFEIVITQPSRFIDKFFQVFVWIFGPFLSFMMGVLIQKEQLMMIISKPIAPMTGFLIQYTIMPLVSSFLSVNIIIIV